MPFGGLLSLGTGLFSAGSALGGLFGGSSNPVPQGYQYANQGGADAGAYGGTQQLGQYNLGGQYLPQYQNLVNSSINNPYAPGYQTGANTSGSMGMGAGASGYGSGVSLTGAGLSALPDVSALLSLGFDPQNALYDKLQQQNTDQTRAGLEARGLDSSPYGAGVENTSNQNFNLGWQNNLLQRASQGAGAAGGLLGNIGSGLTTGAGLQTGGANEYLQGAGTPYSAFNNINASALGTLQGAGAYGQTVSQIPQQQIQDYLTYLQGGNSATQTGINSSNAQFSQNQILGANLGSSLAGISRGWNAPVNPFAGVGGGASWGGGGNVPQFG